MPAPFLPKWRSSLLSLVFCLGLALCSGILFTGCAVRLIAQRSQQVLDDTKALQKQTDLYIIKLERACGQPAGSYQANTARYDEFKAAASSLRIEVEAIPKNEKTTAQVVLLQAEYDKLEALHKERCNPATLESSRTLLNTIFKAILTLEEAKAE